MPSWVVLKDKEIISILIGDICLENKYFYEDIQMPYMDTEEIYDFGRLLGVNLNSNEEKLSR